MAEGQNEAMKSRVQQIRDLTRGNQGSHQFLEAGGLVAIRAIVTLYEQGSLKSPQLAIAHEIEGNFLDIAQAQAQVAETSKDANQSFNRRSISHRRRSRLSRRLKTNKSRSGSTREIRPITIGSARSRTTMSLLWFWGFKHYLISIFHDGLCCLTLLFQPTAEHCG